MSANLTPRRRAALEQYAATTEPLSVWKLERLLDTNGPGASRVQRWLRERGFITRRRTDAPGLFYVITDAGRSALASRGGDVDDER